MTTSCILAIETSCDDTCAAVVTGTGEIRSNVISSQTVHDQFGGVVPEIASRHHLELVNAVVEDALRTAGVAPSDLTAVAATRGPGLIAALLVGFSAAKAYAAAWDKPFVPVDHLRGHIAANLLGEDPMIAPFVCLIASGGHTLLCMVDDPPAFTVIGQTLDDAAGEAFDKGARILGLPYPGGVEIDRLSGSGDATAFSFPRSLPGELDFSYSGVKTALLYKVRDMSPDELARNRADLAASYQLAVVEPLVERIRQAVERTGIDRVAIGGGVAANSLLRQLVSSLDVEVHIPPRALCTDNAAMIASAARFQAAMQPDEYLGLDAYPTGLAPGIQP